MIYIYIYIYIYETWKESLVFLFYGNDMLNDNDNALFMLINDVRQSLFLDGLSRNYLVMEVTTAVECQIS